jgi:hypothetical protein
MLARVNAVKKPQHGANRCSVRSTDRTDCGRMTLIFPRHHKDFGSRNATVAKNTGALCGCFLLKRTWAQASGRTHAPMQFVVAVGFATLRCDLLRALYFVDSVDFLMVCAICCAPPLGWSRLMLIPMLNTSDRTRTTWATARQAGLQHFAGFNPRPPSVYRMQSRDSWSQVPGFRRW